MKIALLSDIHSNIQALHACLADARARNVDRFAFLGDFVGYGADPGLVVDEIIEHVAEGAIAVRGNHDEAIYSNSIYMNDSAMTAIEYARQVLTAAQTMFLRNLPMLLREGTCCFVHASAASAEKYPYIDSPSAAQRCAEVSETPHTFCGHVHEQLLYFGAPGAKMTLFRPTPGIAVPVPSHRRWVALIGSVGQPRDRNPKAGYTIFDSERNTMTFCRVSYDHFATAARIREAGLPESIAYRIEHGF